VDTLSLNLSKDAVEEPPGAAEYMGYWCAPFESQILFRAVSRCRRGWPAVAVPLCQHGGRI